MRASPLLATLPVVLLSTSALAQRPVPGMATMDRFDRRTKFAASLSYLGLDADDTHAVRFDLFGQYATRRGVGGYAMLPLSYLDDPADSDTAIGNLELGGLYVVPGDVPVVLRGGVALQTADDDKFFANLAGALARFHDAASFSNTASWLRLSAHPLLRRGNAFFKADLGIDVPIFEDDGVDANALVRVNAGGGVQTGGVAVMAELTNIATTENDVDDRWVSALGFTARFVGAGRVQPALSVQLPVDDTYDDIVDFVLVLGVEYIPPRR